LTEDKIGRAAAYVESQQAMQRKIWMAEREQKCLRDGRIVDAGRKKQVDEGSSRKKAEVGWVVKEMARVRVRVRARMGVVIAIGEVQLVVRAVLTKLALCVCVCVCV